MKQERYDNINNLFKSNSLESKNNVSYHVIKTDHPFMAEIGLSSFTLDELYSWLSKTNAYGQYVNIPLIYSSNVGTTEEIIQNAAFRLLHNSPTTTDDNYYFTAFRKINFTGNYLKYKNVHRAGWSYKTGNVSYDSNTLKLSEYNNKKTKIIKNDEGVYSLSLVDNNNIDQIISNIVEMNDYIRYYRIIYESNFDNADENTKAQNEFLIDIKTSIEKCLTWQSVVPFNLDPFLSIETTEPAIKNEIVTYRLYLFDESFSRDSSRKVTLNTNNLFFTGPKIDNTGRTGNVISGEVNQLNQSPVAGTLETEWVEYEGRFRSGTPQNIGILSTDIQSANLASLKDIKDNPIEAILDANLAPLYFPSGNAIIIKMQNGNPLQWSPNYALPSSCRGEDTSKQELLVYNPWSRPWSSGEYVMLNKIDGVWLIQQGATPATPEEIAGIVDGKWVFMYLATNRDNYFVYKDGNTYKSIDYPKYEEIFRDNYYRSDDLNKSSNSGENIGILDKINNRGFVQFTSWDFMGPNIGGLQTKNHIGSTQFAVDLELNPYENVKFNQYPIRTAPFFGCVFVDGYNTGDKYDVYRDQIQLLNVKSNLDSGNIFFRKVDNLVPFDDGLNNIKYYKNLGGDNPEILEKGMFGNADLTLQHLPADIALNASPSGNKGFPLLNIGDFDFSNKQDLRNYLYNQMFIKDNEGYQKRYHWMYRDDAKAISAFDFEPKTNAISFRPLKTEIYTSFEKPSTTPNTSGEFSGRLLEQLLINPLHDDSRIASRSVINRTDAGGSMGLVQNPDWGLSYNKLNSFKDGQQSNYFPRPVWSRQWMEDPPIPAGAVGIIGVQCTVTASNRIRLTTDNCLGVGSWFLNGTWYPSWGAQSENYTSFNTTALWARAYQSWPRELTIYDPRFFAVHHFNPGVSLTLEAQKLYFDGKNQVDQHGQQEYPEGKYSVDKIESEVDIRIPTYFDGSPIDSYNDVYRDSQIREYKDWNIDTQRRGKLLPYKYRFKTIGIGEGRIFDGGQNYTANDIFTTSGGNGNSVLLKPVLSGGTITELEIVNRGKDFLPSDFLTTEEYDSGQDYDYDNFTIKIVPKTLTNGTGFRGVVSVGLVYSLESIDEKPLPAGTKDLYRLTPPAVTAPQDAIAGSNGIQTEDKETSILIANKSDNNKYDLFLFFHNDVSHTFTLPDWGGGTLLPIEQNVTLDIDPI